LFYAYIGVEGFLNRFLKYPHGRSIGSVMSNSTFQDLVRRKEKHLRATIFTSAMHQSGSAG